MGNERTAAVVVTCNRPAELRLSVAALLNQTHPLDNIIVWDNASDTPATETLRDMAGITVVRSKENLGGAGGFAAGIQHAMQFDVDWIWVMDDDAVAHPTALTKLFAAGIHKSLRVGALATAVYEDRSIAPRHRRTFHKLCALEFSIPTKHYTKHSVAIDTASFVGLLIRSSVVGSIGLPDKTLFLAYDDTDYSLRIRAANKSIMLVPDSKIDHLRNTQSRMRGSPFSGKHYYNIRNRIVIAWRHGTFKHLSRICATAQGVIIWVSTSAFYASESLSLFAKAIRDGYRMCNSRK